MAEEVNEEAKNPDDADSDQPVSFKQKLLLFLRSHYGGVILVITPLIFFPIVLPWPGEKYQWCAYTLCVMAVYWVTECIPLAITSFIPIFLFPLTGVMDSLKTCLCYMNNTVLVFLASLMLAAAVEQSGLHKRLALAVIRMIGYSHYKLLFAMSFVTMFVSMWLTNTAATTMMVPINFALLKVFEDQNLLSVFVESDNGDIIASDMTTCYFCAATYSATVGGIGTIVGTATNLVFKGLLEKQYPNAPDYLSFPLFSAFAVPYMLVMEACVYLCLVIKFFGFLRPKSAAAKAAVIPSSAEAAAKEAVEKQSQELGPITFWEYMVIILFGSAIILFFARSPQIFTGWGDAILDYYGESNRKSIKDSVPALGVCFLMMLLPATLDIFKNFRAKTHEDLTKKRIPSVLDWNTMDSTMPYSFMFLLGGGFALSTAALKENSNLNGKIGEVLKGMASLPSSIIVLLLVILTIFLTNFASNVAVANVVVPIGMALAENIRKNPLLYNIACGYSASYCFCLHVGTPGNLVVKGAAKIPTMDMVLAGIGPTITTILVSWFFFLFWAPVIWPDLNKNFSELTWI